MTIHKVGNKCGKIIRTGLSVGSKIIATPGTGIIHTQKLRNGLADRQNKTINYQVISLPPPPTILDILRSKTLWGWSGNSTTSDIKASGYSNFTVAGTVQNSVSKIGNALSYTGGNNSAASIRINETLRTANIYTISCWCRWNSFNYAGPWGIYQAQLVSDNGIGCGANNTGLSPSIATYYALANNQRIIVTANSTQLLSINTWYHLVYEKNDTFLRLYINGVLENTSSTFPSGTDFWGTAPNFRLAGYAGSVPTTQLNGYIDEFYIIAGILNQEEIDYLYNNGNGRTLV
jgi:hypothetical protein